jgi:dihydroflavonol-4-reductase
MEKRKAFVTGGTGFVGINVILELLKQGWDVTALHRATSDLTYIKDLDINLVEGSILDPASLSKGIPDGVECIFHIAGNTNQWRANNAQQTLDNVDGTLNVVDAAVAKKARRLVVTSSIAAHGLVTGEIDENTPSTAETSWINYQKSKYLGELEAKKGMERGLEVISINPGAIMGPYDIGTWSRMFLMLKNGDLPGSPPGTMTFTHVEEVAKAHVAAADRGVNGSSYLLGGTNAPFYEMLNEMCHLLGKPTPRILPTFVFQLTAWLQGIVASITHKEPQMTPELVYMLTKDVTTMSEKAQEDLGYQCRPVKEMVEDCYNWMVADGRI